MSSTSANEECEQRDDSQPFKGVRMRKWGRWVSEIRVPKSRSRIWLGSYDTAEKAARAYDAAVYCLHGSTGRFNFPADQRPNLTEEERLALSPTQVKAIAVRHALLLPLRSSSSSESLSGEVTACNVSSRTGDESSYSYLDEFSMDSLLAEEAMSLWDLL